MEAGRDYWRSKYYAEKSEHNALKKVVEKGKKEIYEKVKNHSYPLGIILFVISLRSSSTISLRGVIKVLEVYNKIFEFDYKIPCKSTIQNWEKKHSFHRLEKQKEPITGKWCVIIDESISINSPYKK